MSGITSLTLLSDEQKFNGDNLLQWNTNITQLLGSKGLLGYINGEITKPSPESIPISSEATATQPTTTPIYLSNPTLDEWKFRDQLARGHITLTAVCKKVGTTRFGNKQNKPKPNIRVYWSWAHLSKTRPFFVIG